MGTLIEAIKTTRAEQEEAARVVEAKRKEKEAEEEQERRVILAQRELRYLDCQQVLEESQTAELLNEANGVVFKGRGRISHWRESDHSNYYSDGNFYVGVTLRGEIDKTTVSLSLEGRSIQVSGWEKVFTPSLAIGCYREQKMNSLEKLFRKKYSRQSSSTKLVSKTVEDQGEPVKEWQDIDKVRKSMAKVLVERGIDKLAAK
ncbi:MAG: hypothetical protein V1808_02875 [Candidatus Daviesbacteria bacterium]